MLASRLILAAFFIAAGANHFISPEHYLAITPPFLPWPAALVVISGAVEIAGGSAILFGKTRRLAGIALVALLIVVFPANIHAALHGMHILDCAVPPWMLWTRLTFQPLLIWWVYNACWKARQLPR